MKQLLTVAGVLAVSASAWAQGNQIDVVSRTGPSGTHFDLELPISSYLYEADIYYQDFQYTHTFKVWHNSTLKINQTWLVMPEPDGVTYFSYNVNFSGWGLATGDTVTFYSFVKKYRATAPSDTDYQYGDVVDNQAMLAPAPARPYGERLDGIDDRRRLEDLFA